VWFWIRCFERPVWKLHWWEIAKQVATSVEPMGSHGFRATVGSPFEITVEAESRQEAVRQLHECLRWATFSGVTARNAQPAL